MEEGDELSVVPWKEAIFSDLVDQMSSTICKSLKELPWTGFVSRVDGNTLTIASGSEVGLRKGMLLWVCADGAVVDGLHGEQFVVPGMRLARAKVVEVSPSTCRAELTEEADIADAAWVSIRYRRDRINPL